MAVYDTISRIYAETREEGLLARKLLNDIGDLIRGSSPSVVLDVGAGVGGNLRVTKSFLGRAFYIGCDLSLGMIRASHEPIDWINCSATYVPMRRGFVDLVISIATLHHIPKSLIGDALRDIYEVLKSGGLFVATVWGCNEATVRRLRPINDCEGFITWSHGLNRDIPRYYRLYREGELEGEVSSVGFTIIRSGIIRIGSFINYYLVSRK
ncbi:hypothetical protein JCM14467A_23650 [Vulcanisaeta sp. JCM 14467]